MKNAEECEILVKVLKSRLIDAAKDKYPINYAYVVLSKRLSFFVIGYNFLLTPRTKLNEILEELLDLMKDPRKIKVYGLTYKRYENNTSLYELTISARGDIHNYEIRRL